MKQISKILKAALQIIFVGVFIAYTKRHLKILFWPLYACCTWLLAFILFGIIAIFISLLGDGQFEVIKGLSFDSITGNDSFFYIFTSILFVMLCPIVWKTIQLIEETIEGDIYVFKTQYFILGFSYGLGVSLIVIYFMLK